MSWPCRDVGSRVRPTFERMMFELEDAVPRPWPGAFVVGDAAPSNAAFDHSRAEAEGHRVRGIRGVRAPVL